MRVVGGLRNLGGWLYAAVSFVFCGVKDESYTKVFVKRMGGVPPSPKAVAGQSRGGKEKKLSSERFFPSFPEKSVHSEFYFLKGAFFAVVVGTADIDFLIIQVSIESQGGVILGKRQGEFEFGDFEVQITVSCAFSGIKRSAVTFADAFVAFLIESPRVEFGKLFAFAVNDTCKIAFVEFVNGDICRSDINSRRLHRVRNLS